MVALVSDTRVAWRTVKKGATGHHSGFLPAVRTQRALRTLRERAPVQVDGVSLAAAAHLRRTGWFRSPTRCPQELIAHLGRAVPLAEDPATSVAMGGRLENSVRYVVDPLAHLPRLRELLTPALADTVRAWYGTEFRISTVRMWRIAHVPAEEQAFHHYGNLWHLDGHPVDVLKMFVQVSDSAESQGSAMRFISRPHTRRALVRGYVDASRILPSARRFIEDRAVLFDDPRGTTLFLDTNRCLHRAGNPPPGTTRAMVQLMFLPSAVAPEDGDYFAGIPQDANVRQGAVA